MGNVSIAVSSCRMGNLGNSWIFLSSLVSRDKWRCLFRHALVLAQGLFY